MKRKDEASSDSGRRIDEDLFERATRLGLLSEMLCRAHDDPEWRANVEAALANKKRLGKVLRGGAKPADLWRPNSLLRRQMIATLKEDSVLFGEFALTHPRVRAASPASEEVARGLMDDLDSTGRVLAAFILLSSGGDDYERAVGEACDELEARGTQCPPEVDEPMPERPTDSSEEVNALSARVTQLQADLKAAHATLAARDKELKETKADLKKRTVEVSRKDRKAAELRDQLKATRRDAETAAAGARDMRSERDELKREKARLSALVDSSKTGQRTIEQRRADEAERLQQTIADLRDRLASAQDVQAALEQRGSSLEAELIDERERRTSLEETFDAFGIGDLAESARSLQSTLQTLQRFQTGIVAYSARQAEKEHERHLIQEEAERKRREAEDAQRLQADLEQAWALRERSRLEERERALFPDGQVDYIIIDGHNLVHRVFRPDDEARTRPWLERMAGVMAEQLERRGWQSRVDLVFDTPHVSNSRGAGHGLTIHFHNNVREGGADAKISQLITEGNPTARYMVVSTDRKHVWSDALEMMQTDGTDIDLVQIELLAQYLQTLDDFAN